jgi:hypothetical protein
MDDDVPKLQLTLANMRAVQMQLEDELSVLVELLSDLNESEDSAADDELKLAYEATVELNFQLQPLLSRIEKNGIDSFTTRLTSLERLTFERLGFVADASVGNSKIAEHYLSPKQQTDHLTDKTSADKRGHGRYHSVAGAGDLMSITSKVKRPLQQLPTPPSLPPPPTTDIDQQASVPPPALSSSPPLVSDLVGLAATVDSVANAYDVEDDNEIHNEVFDEDGEDDEDDEDDDMMLVPPLSAIGRQRSNNGNSHNKRMHGRDVSYFDMDKLVKSHDPSTVETITVSSRPLPAPSTPSAPQLLSPATTISALMDLTASPPTSQNTSIIVKRSPISPSTTATTTVITNQGQDHHARTISSSSIYSSSSPSSSPSPFSVASASTSPRPRLSASKDLEPIQDMSFEEYLRAMEERDGSKHNAATTTTVTGIMTPIINTDNKDENENESFTSSFAIKQRSHPMTGSALVIWDYLCTLSSSSSKDVRSELFCMLYDACTEEKGSQDDILIGTFLEAIRKIATREVHTHLIGREQSEETNDDDSDGTVLIDTPMGRLHVVAHVLRMALHEMLRNDEKTFMTSVQKARMKSVRATYCFVGTKHVSLPDFSQQRQSWESFWVMCETSFLACVSSGHNNNGGEEEEEEDMNEQDDSAALVAKFIFPYLVGKETTNVLPRACFEPEKEEKQKVPSAPLEPPPKPTGSPNNSHPVLDKLPPHRSPPPPPPPPLPPPPTNAAPTSRILLTENININRQVQLLATKLQEKEEELSTRNAEMKLLRAQIDELGRSKWRRDDGDGAEDDMQTVDAKKERARLLSVSLPTLHGGFPENEEDKGLYGLVDNMTRGDNRMLRQAMSTLQKEMKEREATMRETLSDVQMKGRAMQAKLGAIYGPSVLTKIQEDINVAKRAAMAAAAIRASSLSSPLSATIDTKNMIDGVMGDSMSLETAADIRRAIDLQFSYEDILPDGSDWDKWLNQSNSVASAFMMDPTHDESSSSSMRKLWEPNKYHDIHKGDPLHMLIHEVVERIQKTCPFSVRLRHLRTPNYQHNDGSCYIMADQKLRVRLDRGIPTVIFAARTESLESYLSKLYNLFTTLPRDALCLRRDMTNDANDPHTKPKVSSSPNDRGIANFAQFSASMTSSTTPPPSHYQVRSSQFTMSSPPSSGRTSSSPQSPQSAHEQTIRNKLRAAAHSQGGVNWPRLFKRYDRDSSGSLEWSEFRSVIRKDGKMNENTLHDTDLKFLFERVDINNNGDIDYNEFIQWLGNDDDYQRERKRNQRQKGQDETQKGVKIRHRNKSPIKSSGYGQEHVASPPKKLNNAKPAWSSHSRRMTSFQKSPDLARTNFHTDSMQNQEQRRNEGRRFEDVPVSSFDLDRRRAHRDKLAKNAQKRRQAGAMSTRQVTQKRQHEIQMREMETKRQQVPWSDGGWGRR